VDLAAFKHTEVAHKNYLLYRIQGAREMSGKKGLFPAMEKPAAYTQPTATAHKNEVGFTSDQYSVLEYEGKATATVRRTGDLSKRLTLDYHLKSGQS
jgi:hypothetical protein